MKKYRCRLLLAALACAAVLTACGRKAAPLVLPDAADIASVTVTAGETAVEHTDAKWIAAALSGLAGAEPTKKASVQDCPLVSDYLKIDVQLAGETKTLFAYEEKGKCYIELPYQGIYEISREVYEAVAAQEAA